MTAPVKSLVVALPKINRSVHGQSIMGTISPTSHILGADLSSADNVVGGGGDGVGDGIKAGKNGGQSWELRSKQLKRHTQDASASLSQRGS